MRKALGVLGAQLAGGETAELPGTFKDPRGYELAGFLAGTCDPGWDLGPHRVRPGDVLVGISSTGPHANGFALIRKLLGPAQIRRQAEVLLAPTRLYHPYVWPLLKDSSLARGVHAMAHVTGGGFFEKLPRALGASVRAEIHWGSWKIPPVFEGLMRRGRLKPLEAAGIWNLGVGFVLAVDPSVWVEILAQLRLPAWAIGKVLRRKNSKEPAVVFG
jgi:phosphoribosylformylglycinamidine cyclo-ligase